MRLVIVTGISGAGKSNALNIMEDMGYYCIDNLPPMLLQTFIKLFHENENRQNQRIAVGIDIRGGDFFDPVIDVIQGLDEQGLHCEILYLEANDEVLIRRYKETRRTHPLARSGSIREGIAAERDMLQRLKENASFIINTNQLSVRQLREKIVGLFTDESVPNQFPINVVSFGFKHGAPSDADMVFDVRFITNPFYIEDLRAKTGMDQEVVDYILQFEHTSKFVEKLYDMVDFLIPEYITEGKGQLTVGIGCTGGQHRSVAIAEMLKNHLEMEGRKVSIEHRHLGLARRHS